MKNRPRKEYGLKTIYFPDQRILVVGGGAPYEFGKGTRTELVDLVYKKDFDCTFSPFPRDLVNPVGGFLDNKPFVCSGKPSLTSLNAIDVCYSLENGKWDLTTGSFVKGEWKTEDNRLTTASNTWSNVVGSVIVNDKLVILGRGKTAGARPIYIELTAPNTSPETITFNPELDGVCFQSVLLLLKKPICSIFFV